MKLKRSLARILRQLANRMDPLVIYNSDNNSIIGFAMEDVAEGEVMIAVSGSLKVTATSDIPKGCVVK